MDAADDVLHTLAAARLMTPKALTTGSGIRSRAPPILKFMIERCVCAPQYLQAPVGEYIYVSETWMLHGQDSLDWAYLSPGTSSGPKVSRSTLVAAEL